MLPGFLPLGEFREDLYGFWAKELEICNEEVVSQLGESDEPVWKGNDSWLYQRDFSVGW